MGQLFSQPYCWHNRVLPSPDRRSLRFVINSLFRMVKFGLYPYQKKTSPTGHTKFTACFAQTEKGKQVVQSSLSQTVPMRTRKWQNCRTRKQKRCSSVFGNFRWPVGNSNDAWRHYDWSCHVDWVHHIPACLPLWIFLCNRLGQSLCALRLGLVI